MDMSLSELREMVMDTEAWRPWDHEELDMTEWNELNWIEKDLYGKAMEIYLLIFAELELS